MLVSHASSDSPFRLVCFFFVVPKFNFRFRSPPPPSLVSRSFFKLVSHSSSDSLFKCACFCFDLFYSLLLPLAAVVTATTATATAGATAAAASPSGMRSVIAGMDRGVEGMRMGGSREIAIPAALA